MKDWTQLKLIWIPVNKFKETVEDQKLLYKILQVQELQQSKKQVILVKNNSWRKNQNF